VSVVNAGDSGLEEMRIDWVKEAFDDDKSVE
jgi:hypothetical protein